MGSHCHFQQKPDIFLFFLLRMYTLLSGLYEQYTRKEEFYCIILGLDNAGKTVNREKSWVMHEIPQSQITSSLII